MSGRSLAMLSSSTGLQLYRQAATERSAGPHTTSHSHAITALLSRRRAAPRHSPERLSMHAHGSEREGVLCQPEQNGAEHETEEEEDECERAKERFHAGRLGRAARIHVRL